MTPLIQLTFQIQIIYIILNKDLFITLSFFAMYKIFIRM